MCIRDRSDRVELTKITATLDTALNKLLAKENFIDGIELQIRLGLKEHEIPHKASIAQALGLSERSMGRALAEKGTTFTDIKNRVLRNLAVAKIEQGIPLAQVAYSLGYNDQSAFTRAYKNWFGSSPSKASKNGGQIRSKITDSV